MTARHFPSALLLMLGLLPAMLAADVPYHSPISVAADPITGHLFIAQKTARQILEYDTDLDSVLENDLPTIPFPEDLSGVALSPDRKSIFATTTGVQGILYVIDRQNDHFVTSIPVGHYPSAPLASALAPEVFVCHQFANKISVVNLTTKAVVAEIPTRYQPYCMALTPDSTRLLVGHLIPDMAANADSVYPHVSVYNTQTRQLVHEFPMLDGTSGLRGICVSPDGHYAYATHLVGRYKLPTTHIERGWIWTNAVTIMDLVANNVVNTVLIDDVEKGAANPWPISCTADGDYLCVATAGSEELMVIDRAALHARLALVASGQPYKPQGVNSAAEVPNDLGFMTGLRQRIPLTGKGARSMAVIDRRAFVLEYFSDVIDVVPDIGPNTQPAYAVALSGYGNTDPMQFNHINLPASEAQLPADGVVLEAGGHLGLWDSLNAVPKWTVNVPKDGNYMVFLTASAASGQGGTYQIKVDGVPYSYPPRTVTITGSWDRYREQLGAQDVILTAGSHEIELQPLSIKGACLMNLSKLKVTTSETDLERVGEILFNDGTVCYQSWLSCVSCHPDGRADGLNWDLGNDGLGGTPRNVKSLLNAHPTPPTTVTGVRPHAYASVRAGYKSIEFVVVPETYNVATDAYLMAMKPVPSPYLESGGLSAAAQRGALLFSTRCASCHGGPYFTSSAGTGLKFDVGTGGPLDAGPMDAPSLIESWRTAPYLNHGGATTMRDAIAALKNIGPPFSGQELDDLAEYVLSIGPESDGSSTYVAWQWVRNSAAQLPDDTDLDQDGVPQLLEYFLGTDPYHPDPAPLQQLVWSQGQLHWQFPGRKAADDDIEAVLYYSPDMMSWSPFKTLSRTPCDLYDIAVPVTGPAGFFRLKVSNVSQSVRE